MDRGGHDVMPGSGGRFCAALILREYSGIRVGFEAESLPRQARAYMFLSLGINPMGREVKIYADSSMSNLRSPSGWGPCFKGLHSFGIRDWRSCIETRCHDADSTE